MADSEVPIDHEECSLRSHSRDRDDRGGDRQRDNRSRSRSHSEDRGHDGENFSLYITHLSYETKDDVLRATFEKFGKVEKAAVIREPVTHVSRGFAFVTMSTVEESNAAIDGLNNTMLDGKEIKVERARRTVGYEKTPGQYLGPPGLSSRFIKERRERESNHRRNSRDRRDNRGRSRDNRGRERSRDRSSRDRPVSHGRRSRSRSRDRSRDRGRDDRDRLPRGLVGDPRLDLMRDDRYYRTLDPRDRLLLDPRAIELYRRDLALGLRGFPPPMLDARPLFDMPVRGRSPPRGLPGDYPPPRGRSPPRDHRDDRRGPPPHGSPAGVPFDGRGPPPPVAGYAASAYYSNRLPPSRI